MKHAGLQVFQSHVHAYNVFRASFPPCVPESFGSVASWQLVSKLIYARLQPKRLAQLATNLLGFLRLFFGSRRRRPSFIILICSAIIIVIRFNLRGLAPAASRLRLWCSRRLDGPEATRESRKQFLEGGHPVSMIQDHVVATSRAWHALRCC